MVVIPFSPLIGQKLEFSEEIDGIVYNVKVEWLNQPERAFIELSNVNGTVIAYQPVIASPDCKNIQLFPKIIKTNFVYRANAKQFEIGGSKRDNCVFFPRNADNYQPPQVVGSATYPVLNVENAYLTGNLIGLTLVSTAALAGELYPLLNIENAYLSGDLTALTVRDILGESFNTESAYLTADMTGLTVRNVLNEFSQTENAYLTGDITALTVRNVLKESFNTENAYLTGDITALTARNIIREFSQPAENAYLTGNLTNLTLQAI